MIVDPLGVIDYEEGGTGPTLVFVPGSCSTGAAWRPIIRALGGNYRCVTTSLPGYGGTAERRNDSDMSMERVAEAVETVVAKTTEPVHLVGHSFGGLVAAAVAMRGRAPLASLTVLEAPAFMLLQSRPAETHHYRAFVEMAEGYFTAFTRGDEDAVARMIDFYGGKGTFASWPDRIRAYVQETTAVNIWDWRTAFEFPLPSTKLAMIELPSLVVWGGNSHPAAKRANELLAKSLPKARAAELDGAAHFMIATHPSEIAALLADHIAEATAT